MPIEERNEKMKRQLLHTPEGVRDRYKEECEKKLTLQNNLHLSLIHIFTCCQKDWKESEDYVF